MLLCSVSAAVRPRMASMAALRRTTMLLIKVRGGSSIIQLVELQLIQYDIQLR